MEKEKIYTNIDDTLTKYGFPLEAKEDIEESLQLGEEEMILFTFRYLSQ